MNYISAEGLSKSYSEKWLFRNLHIGVNQGERVALIGINGSGKSTLLKILGGLDNPDEGKVSVRKGLKVGVLGQNPVFDEAKTVYDNVFYSGNSLLSLIKDYEKLLLEDPSKPGYDNRLHTIIDKMNEEDAWTYEQQIKEIISRLGIQEYIERPVSVLSGGQRKRVAMAKVLIEEPDLLILDEPTNHLDLETIEWLEALIKSRFQTLLLVTHDRYFLDSVANQIWELDRGELFKYKGNYSYFLEKKAEREEILGAEIDKAKNLMRKELDWIRRQPKARGTKAKYRVDAFEETKAKATQQKADPKLELQMKMARQGGKIMELKKLGKSYGDLNLINDFTYVFKKGDKIGIIGKNGTGKSTFLNILTGAIEPDKGVRDCGDTTVFGYYKQEDATLPNDKRIIEVVKDIAEYVELANGQKITATQFLNMFMFPPEHQYTFVSKLSGGEKKRLQLLLVLIKNPNFLILDEPTNDLDIGTLNVLEDFLLEFGGTLVIVSHDRYFMDRLVDHLFIFDGDGLIKDFPGNYTDFREAKADTSLWMAENERQSNEEEKQTVNLNKGGSNQTTSNATAGKRKLSFKEKTEYETLEKEIAKMEAEKVALSEEMNAGNLDHKKLSEHAQKIQKLSDLVDEKSAKWLELSEFV
ncbi:MAG: ABC-F family ATP-binding cassette domain-containing protein [Cytophagales bacterium]